MNGISQTNLIGILRLTYSQRSTEMWQFKFWASSFTVDDLFCITNSAGTDMAVADNYINNRLSQFSAPYIIYESSNFIYFWTLNFPSGEIISMIRIFKNEINELKHKIKLLNVDLVKHTDLKERVILEFINKII